MGEYSRFSSEALDLLYQVCNQWLVYLFRLAQMTTGSRRETLIPRDLRMARKFQTDYFGCRYSLDVNELLREDSLDPIITSTLERLFPNKGYHFDSDAIHLLAELAAERLVHVFEFSNFVAIQRVRNHDGEYVVQSRDMSLAIRMENTVAADATDLEGWPSPLFAPLQLEEVTSKWLPKVIISIIAAYVAISIPPHIDGEKNVSWH